MTRWRLDLAYDGTEFVGWAAQPGLRSVQGVLQEWIGQVLRLSTPVSLVVAGRTDAGVHAAAQVAHLDLPDDLQIQDRSGASGVAEVLTRRLQRVLPADLAVHGVSQVDDSFDARFSAIWRAYRYRIWDQHSVPEPSIRHRTATVRGELNLSAMATAADLLLGLHDYAAFCRPREGATTIRTLLDLDLRRTEPDGTIELDVRADAFCHSMVRSLVGALVAVGLGRRSLSWMTELLTTARRSSDIYVMPASGLSLVGVGYPSADQWAARAEQARSQRTSDELPQPDLDQGPR